MAHTAVVWSILIWGGIAIHDLGTLIHHAHFSAISIRDQNPSLMIFGGHLFQPFQGGEKVTWLNHSQGQVVGRIAWKDSVCLCWFISTTSSWWFQVSTPVEKYESDWTMFNYFGSFQFELTGPHWWVVLPGANPVKKTLRLSRAAHRTTVHMIFQTTLLPYVWFNLKSAHLRERWSSEKQTKKKTSAETVS